MLGLDMMDMVPAGTIEDMVRANAPDLLRSLMAYARKQYAVAADERISFQIIECELKGKETVIALALVVDAKTLHTKRKLSYYDLVEYVASAPVAKWVNLGKEVKRAADKLEPLQRKLTAAVTAGDMKAAAKLGAQVAAIVKPLSPDAKRMLGFADPEPPPAPKELAPATTEPATQAPPAPELPAHTETTTATEKGDTPEADGND